MIEGVAGVVVWTDRVGELARFYRDVVGLPVHSDHGDFVAFEPSPGVRFSVGRHSAVRGPNRDPFRVMVNLGTTDIHADAARLASAGVAFIRQPEQEGWGGWVATFQDPDGNVIQLLQQPAQE